MDKLPVHSRRYGELNEAMLNELSDELRILQEDVKALQVASNLFPEGWSVTMDGATKAGNGIRELQLYITNAKEAMQRDRLEQSMLHKS